MRNILSKILVNRKSLGKFFALLVGAIFTATLASASFNPSTTAAPPSLTITTPYPVVPDISAPWFAGVDATGSTDSYAGLVAALSYMSSHPGTLRFPLGTYSIASGTSSTLTIPANTTIACDPGTVIQLTGTTVLQPMFQIVDSSHVAIKGCKLRSNSQSVAACSSCYGILLVNNNGSTAVSDFLLQDVIFENAKQNYWVYFLNNSSAIMSHIVLRNVICQTFSGNMSNNQQTNINYPSNCITTRGQATDSGGLIKDVVIDNLFADMTYGKAAIAFYEGISGAIISNSTAIGCGSTTSSNTGGYCFYAYQTTQDYPVDIWWVNDRAINPLSVGFYTAGVKRLWAIGDYAEGQTDTANGTLPKAGIAFNDCEDCHIVSFTGLNNYVCVDTTGGAGTAVEISSPICRSNVANAIGIRVGPNGVTTAAALTKLTNPTISLSDSGSIGVSFYSNSGLSQNPGALDILGGTIAAGQFGIYSNDSGTANGAVAKRISLGGGLVISGLLSNIAVFVGNSATPFIGADFTIDCTTCASTTVGLSVAASTAVTLSDILLEHWTGSPTGYAINAEGARGSAHDIVWRDVVGAHRYVSTDFGIALPTWAGDQTTFIQNFNAVEAGSAASKYINEGWKNVDGSTTWQPVRTLTGN